MDASSHPWLQARCPATAALLVHSLLPVLPLPPLVPLLQASPVGSHDPATYKVLKAYLHSKRIHGGQAYQTPFLSAAYQSELRLAMLCCHAAVYAGSTLRGVQRPSSCGCLQALPSCFLLGGRR